MSRIETLKKREEFLAAASGKRWSREGFVVQMIELSDPHEPLRIGYTASKKVGNAVARNLTKRRMRMIANSSPSFKSLIGIHVVIMGKPVLRAMNFEKLCSDFEECVVSIEKKLTERKARIEQQTSLKL